MNRSAAEVIRHLQARIARLEARTAGRNFPAVSNATRDILLSGDTFNEVLGAIVHALRRAKFTEDGISNATVLDMHPKAAEVLIDGQRVAVALDFDKVAVTVTRL